jgi:hypothetical protein
MMTGITLPAATLAIETAPSGFKVSAVVHIQRNSAAADAKMRGTSSLLLDSLACPIKAMYSLMKATSSRCERRNSHATLMNSFGASQKLRQQRLGHADGSPVTDTIYTHAISEDGKRIAAQLGNAVWGILDASWTEKENGLRVESPKPFVIN